MRKFNESGATEEERVTLPAPQATTSKLGPHDATNLSIE